MNRSLLRENIFNILFIAEFHKKEEFEDQIEMYIERSDSVFTESEIRYITDKSLNIFNKINEIDNEISTNLTDWTIDRLGKCELGILRLAVYEMLYDDDVPVGVAMNEAIELAKKYGANDSTSKFVNAILSKIKED